MVQVELSLRKPLEENLVPNKKIARLTTVLMGWAKMRILLGGMSVTLIAQSITA
jgi:hypothetical protein